MGGGLHQKGRSLNKSAAVIEVSSLLASRLSGMLSQANVHAVGPFATRKSPGLLKERESALHCLVALGFAKGSYAMQLGPGTILGVDYVLFIHTPNSKSLSVVCVDAHMSYNEDCTSPSKVLRSGVVRQKLNKLTTRRLSLALYHTLLTYSSTLNPGTLEILLRALRGYSPIPCVALSLPCCKATRVYAVTGNPLALRLKQLFSESGALLMVFPSKNPVPRQELTRYYQVNSFRR